MKKIKLLLFLLIVFLTGCATQNQTGVLSTANLKPLPQEPIEPTITKARITAIGDIMCHSWQMNDAYDKENNSYNFDHNYSDMKKYFDAADLVVGNLETTTAGEDIGYSDFPMFNSPDNFVYAAKEAGIDVLSTANNHCMDKRKDGLLRTLNILDCVGIDHMGTYASAEDRTKILIKDVKGIKIAFLSYTYGTNGIAIPNDYLVNLLDEDLIKSDLARAKALNPDLIIVMPHMGIEYETAPRDSYKNWADIFFNAGADIVLASHPHVLQPMEFKDIQNADGTSRRGFVIYSLGNFISSQTTPPRNASILLNLDIEKIGSKKATLKEVSFTPIWTQFTNIEGQNDFVVRSVYEMLSMPEDQLFATIRKKDIARLWDIHFETSSLLLNREVSYEEMKDVYVFN